MQSLKNLIRSVRTTLLNKDRQVLDSMRRDWDERARENARHYVATGREEWTDEEFFQSGTAWVEAYVAEFLADIDTGRPIEQMRALEIGCGAGRMTLPLSKVFGHVDAVDVSPEMVARAQEALRLCSNVEFHVNNGTDLSMFANDQFDFAFSALVFQHIPKKAFVENYIRETWRVLRPGSAFRFQVQGCPIDETKTDTWVGAGFSEEDMREIAARDQFVIKSSVGVGTQYYWLTFLKPKP